MVFISFVIALLLWLLAALIGFKYVLIGLLLIAAAMVLDTVCEWIGKIVHRG